MVAKNRWEFETKKKVKLLFTCCSPPKRPKTPLSGSHPPIGAKSNRSVDTSHTHTQFSHTMSNRRDKGREGKLFFVFSLSQSSSSVARQEEAAAVEEAAVASVVEPGPEPGPLRTYTHSEASL